MTINSNEIQPGRARPVASMSATRTRCPNCDLPAIAPVVSTYFRDRMVENDWVCSACGFEWSSSFNGLMV
jgi:transposase-like protein